MVLITVLLCSTIPVMSLTCLTVHLMSPLAQLQGYPSPLVSQSLPFIHKINTTSIYMYKHIGWCLISYSCWSLIRLRKSPLFSLLSYNHCHNSSSPLTHVITWGSSCFVGRFFLCESSRPTCYHQILAREVNTENGRGLGSPGTNQETCAVIPTITGILYHQIDKTTLHLYKSKSSHGINPSVFKKWFNNSLHPIILHRYKNLEL